jgi:hypothetical protein
MISERAMHAAVILSIFVPPSLWRKVLIDGKVIHDIRGYPLLYNILADTKTSI